MTVSGKENFDNALYTEISVAVTSGCQMIWKRPKGNGGIEVPCVIEGHMTYQDLCQVSTRTWNALR